MIRRIFFLLVLLNGTPAGAQNPADSLSGAAELTRILVDEGFEYVSTTFEPGGDRIVVSYENRLFRYEIDALSRVAAIVAEELPESQNIILVPRRRGLPLATVSMSGNVVESAIDTVGDHALLGDGINPSVFKLDVVVHPELEAQFGSYSDAVRTRLNLTPEARLGFWPGMMVSGRLVLPLYNELEPEGDDIRPGPITLNQTVRLPGNTFVSATGGYFSNDRYGLDGEILTTLREGRIEFGARAGRTGFARFADREWQYARLNTWTFGVSTGYNLPRYTLSGRVTYGRFLAGDSGVVVDVDRRFGEVEVGFFGIVTDGGENAGFRVAVPLFMKRHLKPRRIRIRSADRFRWRYRYRGLTTAGVIYDTGHALSEYHDGLIPPFLQPLSARRTGD